MNRSTKTQIRHTLQDTLWPELFAFLALLVLVAVFGFQIWLLALAIVSAATCWRRAVIYDRRHPLG